MKTKLLLFLFLLGVLTACDKDDPVLELSDTTFETDGQAATFQIDITSDADWTVESSDTWCSANITKGSKDNKVTLTVKANPESVSRTATVLFKAGKNSKTVTVIQGPKINTETYHYKLPVIFHVLYTNESNTNTIYDEVRNVNPYIGAGRLSDIMDKCNAYFRASSNPVRPDMNMEFVLATEDPQGVVLKETGVERIKISAAMLDCEKFMDGKEANNSTYVSYLWDPNKYINVFVYAFTDKNTLGISHLPYVPTAARLEGLYATDYYATGKPNYPHSVSVNSRYMYYESDSKSYTPLDVVVTLSHELGHYIGLHHTFSESEDDLCEDTDFCDDTPTYNREEYYAQIDRYFEEAEATGRDLYLSDLVMRKNCEGLSFTARNVMDYAYCYSDQFTNDQRGRIRHVLANSPLIPGPKETHILSRSPKDVEVPPIIFKK